MISTDTTAPDGDNTAFASLPLTAAFLDNLDSLGYKAMTTIQAESLPAVLEGRDLIAQAKTGSGKTAAFGIGILNKLNPAWFAVQGLVLCPTRELADQVAGELRRLARARRPHRGRHPGPHSRPFGARDDRPVEGADAGAR